MTISWQKYSQHSLDSGFRRNDDPALVRHSGQGRRPRPGIQDFVMRPLEEVGGEDDYSINNLECVYDFCLVWTSQIYGLSALEGGAHQLVDCLL
jgi:hypothetical protein